MNAILVIFFISFILYSLFNNLKFLIIYFSLIGLYTYITQFRMFSDIINSARRKIQIGTWGKSFDPQTYSKVKIDISRIEPYLEKKSKEVGDKITLTMYAIKLMSIVLKKYPEINGYINLGKVNYCLFFLYSMLMRILWIFAVWLLWMMGRDFQITL